MTNTQSNADLAADTLNAFTAPVRDLIANVRKIEASFKQERQYILQHRPDEQVGDFPLLDGLGETMDIVDLELLKTSCFAALKNIQRHADKVEAEVDEAERIRAEQNMTEVEALRRAVYHLAARVAKLEDAAGPPAPYVAPNRPPMGGPLNRNGGVRKLGTSAPASAPDAMGAGFTRRIHPLDVIGGGGRR
jgi:hypothetical protein